MANYYASARTNYVHIENLEGLTLALDPFEIIIAPSEDQQGLYCFLADSDSGGWPSVTYMHDEDTEVEFSFENSIMPYIKEGECLVTIEVGAEKLRYLEGYTVAYVRHGDKVKHTSIHLDNIYKKAQYELGCVDITQANY